LFSILISFSVAACDIGGVSAEPLHSDGASAKDPSIHRSSAAAAGRAVRRWLCSVSISQDVLSRPSPRHVAHQVSDDNNGTDVRL